MTALSMAVLGAMILVTGLLLVGRALRPAPPSLAATVEALTATPSRSALRGPGVGSPSGAGASRVRPVTAGWRLHVDRFLTRMGARVPVQDLAILGKTPAQIAASRLGLCAGAFFFPSLLSLVMAIAGLSLPFVLPAGVGIGLAVGAWYVQEMSLRDDADKLRAQFTAALTSYLSLVALERQVSGSPVEALTAAARLSPTWPFRLIETSLVRAELAGIAPWEGLRDLGTTIGVERLRSLADIVAAADDGAAVFASLMAEARSMRAAELSEAQAKANVISEQLGQPLALLTMSNIVLGMLPALLRLFNA